MKKKILIIGAGFLQSFIIKKAKELGYYTITIDKNPSSMGFKYADEFKVIDIVNQEACLAFAKAKNIDGVVTGATDYGVLTVSYISKALNLPGLDYEVAKIIKDKYKVRKRLYNDNIDGIYQFYEIKNQQDLDEIVPKLEFPVMVKPCDGSGSKATRRVDSVEELRNACNEAIQASLVKKALIEDFIVGKEYGVECFVNNNNIYVLGIMGKKMTNPPQYAELGHFIPSKLAIENKVKTIAKNAIQSLGVNFGSINMDILVTENNEVSIVDIGARMGGNLIGSHIIPMSTDFDYLKAIIESALGKEIDFNMNKRLKSVATNILALTPGKVKKIPDLKELEKEHSVVIYHQLIEGDIIKEYQNNLDGCGYVIAEDSSIDSVLTKVNRVKKIIDTEIIRVENFG